MGIGYVFPGQGAQEVGMLGDLRTSYGHLDERLVEASEVINEDLIELITNGPSSRLNETEVTQPVMLASSVALYEVWREAGGPEPSAVAGHSLGEYSALTVAGVFDFNAAVKLVRERGKLMQSAVPVGEGAMAAILGLELDELSALCDEADGVVSPANINSPGQVVIAGAKSAVDAVCETVTSRGDRRQRVVPLDVSVPSHCELMKPAAEGVEELLLATTMNSPNYPIYHNVDAEASSDVEGIRSRLIRQLSSPVRWADIVTTMVSNGCDTLIECGPGKVLTGLSRRIDRGIAAKAIGTVDDFNDVLSEFS